jgi:uncharacterized YigZ family protein
MRIYTYTTIRDRFEGAYHDSGSKFIAYAIPVENRAQFVDALASIKSLHPKARHHCYAYRILNGHEITEYSSDAGEPSGSAGPPILGELRRHVLLNICVCVVRYFGGTKLGIPGLIHAYQQSTAEALRSAQMIRIVRKDTYLITIPVVLQPLLYSVCKHLDIDIRVPEYGDLFTAQLLIPIEHADDTIGQLRMRLPDKEGVCITPVDVG